MRVWLVSLMIAAGALASGCASLHPSSKSDTVGGAGWKNYAEMESAYETIEVGKTTREDLAKLGIILPKGPGVRKWTQTELVNKLLPGGGGNNGSGSIVKLTKELEVCMDYNQKTRCEGYDIEAEWQEATGQGNIVLRATGFRAEDRIFSGQGKIEIVLHHDVAIYADIGGTPVGKVTIKVRRNPLGPLRSLRNLSPETN